MFAGSVVEQEGLSRRSGGIVGMIRGRSVYRPCRDWRMKGGYPPFPQR
jgi:hypothetical protein